MKPNRKDTNNSKNSYLNGSKKAFQQKLLLYLCLFFLIFNISCSEDSLPSEQNIDTVTTFDNMEIDLKILNKDYIQNATLREKLVYKDYHLTSLMEEVLKVYPDFGNLNEFKKKNNDDRPAVYLESLLNNFAKNTSEENTSLGAFADLEGETWYPVLELLEEGDNTVENNIYLVKSYDENLDKEFVKAYMQDENGDLNLIDNDFTENEFTNNTKINTDNSPVYVLSILQPCEGEDTKAKDMSKLVEVGDCSSGGGGSGGGSGDGIKRLTLKSFVIKDKKESWLEKADIHIFGYNVDMKSTDTWGDGGRFHYFFDKGLNYESSLYLMAKVSSKDVKNGVTKTVNFDLVSSSWDGFTVYVIYELDFWPAPIKYSTFDLPDGTRSRVYWRSYNSKYTGGRVKSNKDVQFDNFPLIYGFGYGYGNSVIDYKHNSY